MPQPFVADTELRAAFLGDNLAALGVAGATAERIRDATAAELVELGPGATVIQHGAAVLGAPVDDASIRQACPPGSRAAVVVFGLGSGQTVRAVRAVSDASVVVYEPEPGIARAVLEQGPTDLGDTDLVCTLHDLNQLWPELSRGAAGATLVRTPGYSERFPAEQAELERTLHALVQRIGVNQNTHRVRARTWIEDLLANVGALRDSVPFLALRGKYAGVPAFIVGAGPSLAKNAHLLGEARDKGIVIAVNSSARALASRGIAPQVLCCIESIDVSHLLGPLPFIDQVVRAFSLSGHPATLRTGRGPLLPVWEAIPELAQPLERLTGLPGLAVSGSVSTLAFSLAHALGCSPIVLVGQDLAYTGQRAYAEGTPYEGSSVEIGDDGQLRISWCGVVRDTRARGAPPIHDREPLELVPAWGGEGTVPSGASFAGPRGWLAGAAEVLRRAGAEVELINATEGGSHLTGWAEQPLSTVLARLPERRIESQQIARDARDASEPLRSAELGAWALEQMAGARAVRAAARRARRAAQVGLAAIQAGSPRRITRAFERLDQVERELRARVAAAPMVDAWAFAPVDRALGELHDALEASDARADAERGIQREMAVARAIQRAAQELEAALQSVAAGFAPEPRLTHRIQGEGSPCRL